MSAFALQLESLTAPLLTNCRGRTLGLQTADLQVTGHVTRDGVATSFTAYVSLDIPVELDIMAGRPVLRAAAGQVPFFGSEVVSTPALDPATTASLEEVVMQVLVAEVQGEPGEDELAALAEGALRAVTGEEPARDYTAATGRTHA